MTPTSDYAQTESIETEDIDWWEEATNLPDGAVPCGMNRRFCGECPENPPCLSASLSEIQGTMEGTSGNTSIWPCKLCTSALRKKWAGIDQCPCWETPFRIREKKYKEWKIRHNRDNNLTAERRKKYGKKRHENSDSVRRQKAQHRYRKGKTCTLCGMNITDKNETGYCKKHAHLGKDTQ